MNEIRSTKSIALLAVEAVRAGRDINANPFPPGSEAHTVWRRVFEHARSEMVQPRADRSAEK